MVLTTYIETQATRVTGFTSTFIDFFVTNFDVSSIIADVISVDVSDHLPIFLLINKPRFFVNLLINK